MADREARGTVPGFDTSGMLTAIPYVFVSYRRDDVPDATDRLASSLFDRFGRDHVFVDVDSIEIGSNFGQVVADWIGQCDVLLVVIGRDWLAATDDEGRRRLDSPKDYVRLEIEAGLDRDTRVVPVLIHGATIPKARDLPENLVPLLDRQAVELSRPHWELDVEQLVTALERVAAQRAARKAAEHRRVDQAPDARDAGQTPQRRGDPVTPTRQDTGSAAAASADAQREQEATAERQAFPEHEAEPQQATTIPPDRETVRSAPRPDPMPPREHPTGWRSPRVLAAVAAAIVAVVVAVIVLTSGSSSSAPLWQRVTSLPTPLEGAGVATYRREVWIAGGCANPAGGCGHTHDVRLVYHYNPRTGVWRSGPSLPAALNHPAMVSDGSHLYVLGGFGADGQAVATVFRLDSPTGTWQPDSPLPGPRGAGAAAWDGKRIVFAGGADGDLHARADVWSLSGTQWSAIGQLQQARSHLGGASDGHGTVWFVGGKNATGQPASLVDVVRGESVTPSQPVVAVTGNAAVAVGSGFCTMTGGTDAGNTGAVQCQPNQSIPALDPPRDYVGATVLDHKIYVVGGFERGHFGGIRDVESLDIEHIH